MLRPDKTSQRHSQLYRPARREQLRGRTAFRLATSAALVALLLAAMPLAAANDDLAGTATDDAQDLLFFGPLRPIWIRLHVVIDGQAFREVWRANLRRVFNDADTDQDGAVPLGGQKQKSDQPPGDTVAELARLAAVYLGQDVASAEAGLKKLAGEHGDTIRLDDFEEYFRQIAPPFAIAVGVGRTSAGQALFPLLDADGDQQLTSDELNAAEARLRIRDFDDNESLTRAELVDAPNASLAAQAQSVEQQQSSPLLMAGPLAMLDRAAAEAIGQTLLAEYDRDHDGRLSTAGAAAEVIPTTSQLARLGVEAGEELTAKRLEQFCSGSPDLELKVELGKISLTGRRIGGTRSRRAPDGAASTTRLKQRPDGSWDVMLDDAKIYLRRNNRDPSKNADNGPSLQTFDADDNGYLDEKELAGAPNLAGAFATIDADHDGKIFAGELNAYTDRQNRAASVRLLLEVFDQGQELFDHLDENHDFRLSTRELHGAAEIVKQIDGNHDGRLSAGEIPQQLMLELSRNTPGAAVAERRSIRGGDRVRTAAKRGPSWFQKMDRNDDGEVSPREFLGPADLFDRLDPDHNGVIDAKEAEDAKERAKATAIKEK
jgi:Ca2+-binding EF-hand superfamily protein